MLSNWVKTQCNFAAVSCADNLYSYGSSASSAITIAEDWAHRLFTNRGLRIGGEEEVIECAGGGGLSEKHAANGWQFQTNVKAIGRTVAHDGGIEPPWQRMKIQLWRAARTHGKGPHGPGWSPFKKAIEGNVWHPIWDWLLAQARSRWLDDFQTWMLVVARTAPRATGEGKAQWFVLMKAEAVSSPRACGV